MNAPANLPLPWRVRTLNVPAGYLPRWEIVAADHTVVCYVMDKDTADFLVARVNAAAPADAERFVEACARVDWVQIRLNDDVPCFHIEADGRFCGRALRWEGHQSMMPIHLFEPLHVAATRAIKGATAPAASEEREDGDTRDLPALRDLAGSLEDRSVWQDTVNLMHMRSLLETALAQDEGRVALMRSRPAASEALTKLRLLREWHDDDGPALFFTAPVREPPFYAGTPNDDDWPGGVDGDFVVWCPMPKLADDGSSLLAENQP